MFKNVFLLLIFVHILGDYYFQTDNLSKIKDESFSGLVTHTIIYLGCSILLSFVVIDTWILQVSLISALVHFIIDYIKFCYIKKCKINDNYSNEKEGIIYVIDQLLHVSSFAFISIIVAKNYSEINIVLFLDEIFSIIGVSSYEVFLWVLVILLIAKPTNITIKKLLSSYRPSISEKEIDSINKVNVNLKSELALIKNESESTLKRDDDGKVSLEKSAGGFIGLLERFIIVIFMFINQYSAIGLVLTAKSIARYDMITKNQEFAEYYLLGTLLSTLIVIIIYLSIM